MLFYTILGFIRPALAVFLLPLYTNVFTEDEWAVYSLMLAVAGFAVILATLRINAAMLTKYYDYFHDRVLLHKYLRSIFTTSLAIGTVILLAALVGGPYLFDYIFESDKILFFPYGISIMAYAVLGEINQTYYIFLRNEKNLSRYALVMLSQVLLVIILQFVLIVIFRAGIQGAIMGMVLANAVTVCMILYLERRILGPDIDLGMIKDSLKFSIPLIPYLIIYWFMTKGERVVIEQFMDLSSVGHYILLATITGVIILLIEAIINGVRPFLFEMYKRNDPQDTKAIQLLTGLIVNGSLLGLPAVILLGKNIRLITGNPSFYIITDYISHAAVIAYLVVYAKLFYQQLVFRKKSGIVTLISLVAALIFACALWILAPQYGINGVLVSVMIVNLSLGTMFYVAAQKVHLVRYEPWRIFVYPFSVLGLIMGADYFLHAWITSPGITGLLIAVLTTIFIIFLNINSIKEYRSIF